MIIVKHRVNNSKELKKININFGVEIDLRSKNKDIYLHHDPFKKGELFSKWIKSFKHKLIVLNVKEEGLEPKILSILKRNNVRNYFFHDQTFSSLIKNMHKTKVSVRYSEFEGLKKVNKLFNSIKWLWVDNFSEIKIDKKFYYYLKKKKVKICIVSPELVKKSRSKEIKKVISYLKENKFKIDAVCTKNPNFWIN
tara:strand:+ start:5571 stop:6155 length:585 start_codon:yes stop_codon:yes gene_type:complete